MKHIIFSTALLFAGVSANAQTTYSVDAAHSSVGFIITHLKLSQLPGSFEKFDVKFSSEEKDFSDAKVEMTADINTIYTGSEGRDKHLQSEDFFDAEKFPTLKFVSTSFKKSNGNTYKVTGELTMHGVTKTVTLDADMVGVTSNPRSKKDTYVWKVTGKVKRSDFGIADSMPSDMVDNEVMLNANLEIVKG